MTTIFYSIADKRTCIVGNKTSKTASSLNGKAPGFESKELAITGLSTVSSDMASITSAP